MLRSPALRLLLPALIACSSSSVIGNATPATSEPVVEPSTTLSQVDPQDVTVVYPLPASAAEAERMLKGTSVGAFGELVPREAFGRIAEPLDARSKGPVGAAGEPARLGLHLVAVRLDPCFGVEGKESVCKAQMRLVFQGMGGTGDGPKPAADDGAVHVFVEMPQAELVRTVKQVLTLREKAGGYAAAPLGVHPVLEREGLGGAFAQGLRSIVLEHGGASRVTRMTFFRRTNSRQGQWIFGIFDAKSGAFAESPIATTTATTQTLVAGIAPSGQGLAGRVENPTSSPDDMTLLLDTAKATSAPREDFAKAVRAAERVENPRFHSPDTMDCVSCHTATAALRVSAQNSAGGDAYRTSGGKIPAYAAPAAPSLENVHALSYLGSELGINQRTANESHSVTVAVNALLAKP